MAASQAKLQDKQMSLFLRIGGCLPLSAQVVACPELSLSPGPRNTRPPPHEAGNRVVLLHSSLEPGHQVHVKLCADMRSGSTGWGEEASVRRPQEAGALAAVAESLEVAPPCPGRHPSYPPPHVIKSDTCPSGQS